MHAASQSLIKPRMGSGLKMYSRPLILNYTKNKNLRLVKIYYVKTWIKIGWGGFFSSIVFTTLIWGGKNFDFTAISIKNLYILLKTLGLGYAELAHALMHVWCQ